jgi:anti-sigma regulatory factor (Ser/Thr protein kinase)
VNAPQASTPACHAAFPLDGSRDCVSAARDYARAYLEQCAPPLAPAAIRDALTVVSEMVTNAVLHAPGPCSLYLVTDREELTVAVSDTSTELPRPRTPDLHGAGGFGWHLMTRLAGRIDIRPQPPYGKTVSATIKTLISGPPGAG